MNRRKEKRRGGIIGLSEGARTLLMKEEGEHGAIYQRKKKGGKTRQSSIQSVKEGGGAVLKKIEKDTEGSARIIYRGEEFPSFRGNLLPELDRRKGSNGTQSKGKEKRKISSPLLYLRKKGPPSRAVEGGHEKECRRSLDREKGKGTRMTCEEGKYSTQKGEGYEDVREEEKKKGASKRRLSVEREKLVSLKYPKKKKKTYL